VGALGIETGSRVELRFEPDRYYAVVVETYADATHGELLLYEDSYGVWSIAISGGDATRLIGAAEGDRVVIAPAE
jgi:S-adenosylmethionine hydrolase